MNTKKLYRPKNGRKLAGVCEGLGVYFNIDPTIIRVVFVFLMLPGGLPGVIPYLLLWLVMPDESAA
jgi:phage shock protein C